MFRRAPTADDPIVPRAGKWRDAPGHAQKTGGDLMDTILMKLDMPPAPMAAHALRSMFISMALR